MTESPPEARLRRNRGLALVWLVPIAAVGIVVWLGVRTIMGRGPQITVTFETADGLEEGRTKVRHNSVDIGTVEDVALSPDLSHVVVTARLDRDVATHVTSGAEFWIVRPRLSPGGLSGLSTLVSGSYIEMEPGQPGEPMDHFAGLEDPPVVLPADPGGRFTLSADDLGSLGQGSPIYYRGIPVGEVLGDELTDHGNGVHIFIFVRAPYNRYVHDQSRFWNASGISISAGPTGVHASTQSLQALVTGGIAFDTAAAALATPPSHGGAEFQLFGDEVSAHAQPLGQTVKFLINLPGPVHGLVDGAAVELKGMVVGQVTDVHLAYDATTGTLSTPATLDIDPDRIRVDGPPSDPKSDRGPAIKQVLARLVHDGLRARLATGSLLTGQRLISLEIVSDVPVASLDPNAAIPELPAMDSGDLDSLTSSATRLMGKLQVVVENLGKLTGSPELAQSLTALHHTLANVERLTGTANTSLPPLLDSLRKTSDAANRTLDTATKELGGGAERSGDLPAMLHELTETARSVRALADFLDQHPEALLHGRSGNGE